MNAALGQGSHGSILFKVTALGTALALAGCGGGGSSSGVADAVKQPVQNNGTNNGTTSNGYRVAIATDKTYLNSTGDTVTATVKVVDANGGGVAGQQVTLAIANSIKNGVTIAGSSSATTDEQGNATFVLNYSANGVDVADLVKNGVTLGATVTDPKGAQATQVLNIPVQQAGAATSQYSLDVAASKVTLNAFGDTLQLTANVKDKNGGGVANQSVTLSLPQLNGLSVDGPSTVATGTTGQAVFNIKVASGLSEADRLALTGQPLSATLLLTEANGSTKTASTTVTAYQPQPTLSGALIPSKTSLNIGGDTLAIQARVADQNGGGVEGQSVTLNLPATGTGLFIDGPSTQKSDANGVATFNVVIPTNLSAAQQQALAALKSFAVSATVTETSGASSTMAPLTIGLNLGGSATPVNLTLQSAYSDGALQPVLKPGQAVQVVSTVQNAGQAAAGQNVQAYLDSGLANLLLINGKPASEPAIVPTGADGRARFTVQVPAGLTADQRQQLAAAPLVLRTRLLDSSNNATTIVSDLRLQVAGFEINKLSDPTPSRSTFSLGGDQIAIAYTVATAADLPLAGQSVVFALANVATSAGITVDKTTAVTDATGQALFVVNVPANLTAAQKNQLAGGFGYAAVLTQPDGSILTRAGTLKPIAANAQYSIQTTKNDNRTLVPGDTLTVTSTVLLTANSQPGAGQSVSAYLDDPRAALLTLNGQAGDGRVTVTTDANGKARFQIGVPATLTVAQRQQLAASPLTIRTVLTEASGVVTNGNAVTVSIAQVPVYRLLQLPGNPTAINSDGGQLTVGYRVLDSAAGVPAAGVAVKLALNNAATAAGVTVSGDGVSDASGNVSFVLTVPANAPLDSQRALQAAGIMPILTLRQPNGNVLTLNGQAITVIQPKAQYSFSSTLDKGKNAQVAPGQTLTLTAHAQRMTDGQTMAGQQVEAWLTGGANVPVELLTINGQPANLHVLGSTDANGNATFAIKVPATLTTAQRIALQNLTINSALTENSGQQSAVSSHNFSVEQLPVYALSDLSSGTATLDLSTNQGGQQLVTAQMTTTVGGTTGSLANQPVKIVLSSLARSLGVTVDSETVTTDGNGKAVFKVNVKAGLSDAELSQLRAAGITYNFTALQADGTTLTTSPSAITATANKVSYAVSMSADRLVRAAGDTFHVFVRARDANGNLMVGKATTLSSTSPYVTITNATVNTDANGVADFEVKLQAGLDPAKLASGIPFAAIVTDGGVEKGRQVYIAQVDTTPRAVRVLASVSKPTLTTGGLGDAADRNVITLQLLDANGGQVKDTSVVLNVADPKNAAALTTAGILRSDDTGRITTGIQLINDATRPESRLNREISFTAATTDQQPVYDVDGKVVSVNNLSASLGAPIKISVVGTTLSLTASNTSVNSTSSTEQITYTGVLRDGTGQPIANVPVELRNASNEVVLATATTNANGQVSYTLPANDSRLTYVGGRVSVYARVDERNQSNPVELVARDASSLSFTVLPGVVTLDPVTNQASSAVQVVVRSANLADLTGQSITLSTTLGTIANPNPATVTVSGPDANGFYVGTANFTLQTSSPGAANLTATFNGTVNGAALTPIRATTTVVATNPTKLSLQAEKTVLSPNESTVLRVVVRNDVDAPVANQTVRFERLSDQSVGQLSSGTAVTDANGVATVTYTAGNTVSSTNGVQIRASVPSAGAVAPQTIGLTVASRSTYITLGLADKVTILDTIYYGYQGSAAVTDSAGRPIANQPVTVRVAIPSNPTVAFYKGAYTRVVAGNPSTVKVDQDLNSNGYISTSELKGATSLTATMDLPTGYSSNDTVDLYVNGVKFATKKAFITPLKFEGIPVPAAGQSISLKAVYNYTSAAASAPLGESTITYTGTSSDTGWIRFNTAAACPSEDSNENFQMDSGEDKNGNGVLDPRNVTSILKVNGATVNADGTVTFVTDNNGRFDFTLRYPKQYASWININLVATTSVQGTETRESRPITLPVAYDDLYSDVPPAFETSPFGTQPGCNNAN